MRFHSLPALAILPLFPPRAAAAPGNKQSGTVGATPHDSYSSSVGVLGCKINTNRVAYWPDAVDCDSVCVSLSYRGRKVYLLRVDQSGGAHDVSYDAWNYLYTGYSATEKPTAGGSVEMQFANVDASNCEDLIHTKGGWLPFSAANSMNFLSGCLARPDSWVAKHYTLFNILDPVCTFGYDEPCKLDWPEANQANCTHVLGVPALLKGAPVYNIRYPTGQKVLASSTGDGGAAGGGYDESAGRGRRPLLETASWAWALCGLLAGVVARV
ncbi:Cerato-platanin [Tolypocladium paradoxum]|uniref:Cerato-platanin n=1 Tax=Tolypocladium paradoxum TaxID=94208 RepID=A0A2S4KS28_9HYPO|nr:Cerato-platanin [Tolypocladium paradoxum]